MCLVDAVHPSIKHEFRSGPNENASMMEAFLFFTDFYVSRSKPGLP